MTALSHREPDRVPVDLGSTRSSSLVLSAYQGLNRLLGSEEPPRVFNRWLTIAHPSKAMLERFAIDTRSLSQSGADSGGDTECGDGRYRDEWGVVRAKPAGGLYFDIVESPLAGAIDTADLKRFPWPSPHDPGRCRGLAQEARRLREESDCALVLNMPGGIVYQAQALRGFEEWFTDLAADQVLFHALMEKLADLWIEMAADQFDAVGEAADICWFGDDVAFQAGPMMSLEMYRRMIKPHHQRLFAYIKSRSKAKILYHCCGSVRRLIPDLIDMGVDVLNPVQVSAESMDTRELKKEFGKDVSFWGAIDTQRVLPFGSTEDVKTEVKRRIADLAAGGGYVLCAVHNVQADVPLENISAMYDAAREFSNISFSLTDQRE